MKLLAYLVFAVLACLAVDASVDKVIIYKIEQSFDDGASYFDRNDLEIRLSGKKLSIKSLPGSTYTLPADLTQRFYNMPLTSQAVSASSSSSALKSGFYILKFTKVSVDGVVITSNDANQSSSLITSVRACSILAAKFKEVLRLHIDKSGELIGINYVMPKSGADCPSRNVAKVDSITFQTKFVASLPDDAEPVPDAIKGFDLNAAINAAAQSKDSGDGFFGGGGGSPAPPSDANKGSEGKDQPAKPESIIYKYWYLVVPALLMMLINPAVPEDPQQQQGDGRRVAAADGAASVAGAAATAAAGAAAGAKRRR